jgi:hypothetical protein
MLLCKLSSYDKKLTMSDAMPEKLSAETAQQIKEGLQSMTPNLEVMPHESMYSRSAYQCWHQFRKIVEQHC